MKLGFWKITGLILIPFQILFLNLVNSSFVEKYYASYSYPFLSNIVRAVFVFLPFSIAEIVVIVFFGFIVYKLYKILKKRKIEVIRSIVSIFLGFSIATFIFQIVWGLNYWKLPLNESLKIERNDYSEKELKELCLFLIEKTNQTRVGLEEKMKLKNIQYVLDSTSSFFHQNKINISLKPVFLSKGMSLVGIGGIYFPFTGEANLNIDQPFFNLPFTACHEVAHEMNFAKEDEANFVAYIVCIQSENNLYKYSAYLSALRYAMNELALTNYDKFLEYKDFCSVEVIADIEENKQYWNSFQSPLMDYSDEINDIYLKSNNQENGTESYNLFLELLVSNYQEEGIEKIKIFN